MILDEAVVISTAGRAAIERELTSLLKSRQGARQNRSKAIRDCFGADTMLSATEGRCDDLCSDLGYDCESEAVAALLLTHQVMGCDEATAETGPSVRVAIKEG